MVDNKPAAAKKAVAAPKAAGLDFGSLTVQDVDNTELKANRGSQLDGTPILGWLKESYEKDQAKQVPVETVDHAKTLVQMLRSGAARLDIGVKIVVTPGLDKPGKQTVKFLGKDKRGYVRADS